MNDALMELDPAENRTRVIKPDQATGDGKNRLQPPRPPITELRRGHVESGTATHAASGIDAKGRVWFTLRIRDGSQQPGWCGGDMANQVRQALPHEAEREAVAVFDPKTEKFENVDTCFSVGTTTSSATTISSTTDHRIGRLGDMNTWTKTHDAEKSTGWCPAVIDTNGDGRSRLAGRSPISRSIRRKTIA